MGEMNDAIINKAPLVMSGYMVDFVFLNTFCVRGLGKFNIQFILNGEGGANGFITVKEHRARIRELN